MSCRLKRSSVPPCDAALALYRPRYRRRVAPVLFVVVLVHEIAQGGFQSCRVPMPLDHPKPAAVFPPSHDVAVRNGLCLVGALRAGASQSMRNVRERVNRGVVS